MGELKRALPHMERGIALYDRERHGAYASLYGGHDPGACCRYYLALTQWTLGYPERALATVYEASRLAETLGHAMTSTLTLWFVTLIQYQRGERPAAVGTAERALSIIEAHGFSAWAADTAVLLHAVASGSPRRRGPERAASRDDRGPCQQLASHDQRVAPGGDVR